MDRAQVRGTSVSTLANWRNIARVARKRLTDGARVLIVHSAVSGITDRLESFLRAALAGTHAELLAGIEARHQALAAELGVGSSAQLEHYFAELRQIGAGLALMGERASEPRHASWAWGADGHRTGCPLPAFQGIETSWWDARLGLKTEARESASVRANYLSATCDFAPMLRSGRAWGHCRAL